MPNQDSTRWWLAAEAALGAGVVALPLSLGGAPPWTSWLLVGSGSIALVTWGVGALKHHRRAAWHPLLWLPVVVLLMAAASLVPLPSAVLSIVAPVKAELAEFALVPLGLTGPRAATIDVPSTLRAVARALSFGSLAFVALQLGRRELVRVRLLSVVAFTGALVSVVGFGHALVGAESLFGVWRFSAPPGFLSFFGNTNHLAGYVAFGGTIALGLALTAPTKEWTAAFGVAAIACGVAVFLSLSRGGIASFGVTWLGVAVLQVARRQGGVRAVLPWALIGVTVLLAVGLVSEQLFERAQTLSTVDRLQHTKVELWPMFWEGARAHGLAGMGLGAFELAFTRFQTTQPHVTFTHPENIVLQWVSEVGVAGAVVLALVVGWVALRLWRQLRGALREQIVLVAVAGALLHDVFDFVLELNALLPAIAVALGAVAGLEPSGTEEKNRFPVRARAFGAMVGACLAGGVALGVGLPTHLVAEARLTELARARHTPAELRDAVVRTIDRHPADWVPYAIAAEQLRGSSEALAWVNRLLSLRPNDGRAHTMAARALLTMGAASQALLEFTVAWRQGDDAGFDDGLRLAARLKAHDRLVVDQPGLLSRCWERYRVMGMLDDGRALLDAVHLLPPSKAVEIEAQVLDVFHAQATQNPEEAVLLLRALPPAEQNKPELAVLHATLLRQLGRSAEAITVLEPLNRREPQALPVALMLAELLGLEHRTAEARATLDRTRPFLTGLAARSMLFQREAELWIQDERWLRALDALESASRIEPSRPDLRYRMATVYEKMGSLHSALEEVRKGRLLDTPEGAKSQDPWVGRLESALTSQRPD